MYKLKIFKIIQKKFDSYYKKYKPGRNKVGIYILGIVTGVGINFLTDFIKNYPNEIIFKGKIHSLGKEKITTDMLMFVKDIGFDTISKNNPVFEFTFNAKAFDIITYEIETIDRKFYRIDTIAVDSDNLKNYIIFLKKNME